MTGFSRAEHEDGLARFIAREHRARFTAALGDERLRAKLRGRLAHFAWLDERYVMEVSTPAPVALARQLRADGAPAECVLLSEDDEVDGQVLALEDALRLVLHSDHAAMILCVPGRLAVFSGEAPNETTLLLRRPT